MNDLAKKLELALNEIYRLNQENQLLKQKLVELTKTDTKFTGFSPSQDVVIEEPITKIEPVKGTVHNYSTPSEKIALFRNLFRGREDVYPNRWESKTGKSGDLRRPSSSCCAGTLPFRKRWACMDIF